MGILSGPEITQQLQHGHISIDPFDPKLVNPASVDLRLGDEVKVYSDWVDDSAFAHHQTLAKGLDVEKHVPFDGTGLLPNPYPNYVQDVKSEPRTTDFKISEKGWVLLPGILYLMHTLERVHTERYVPVLDGKSSIGRLGIVIHLTAGYGDPGFDGQYTLEVTAVHPVRVYPGMRFCQMRFHSLLGDHISYKDKGHYRGDDACGPVASKAFTQFE